MIVVSAFEFMYLAMKQVKKYTASWMDSKRKRKYCSDAAKGIVKPPRFLDDLHGVFVTSSSNDLHIIAKSAFSVLRSYTSLGQTSLGTTGTLQDEVQQLNSEGCRFFKVKPGAKGTAFVGWLSTADKVEDIVRQLFEAAVLGSPFYTLARIVPVQHTSQFDLGVLRKTVFRVLSEYFASVTASTTVPLEIDVRMLNNNSIAKSDLTSILMEQVSNFTTAPCGCLGCKSKYYAFDFEALCPRIAHAAADGDLALQQDDKAAEPNSKAESLLCRERFDSTCTKKDSLVKLMPVSEGYGDVRLFVIVCQANTLYGIAPTKGMHGFSVTAARK